MSCGCVCQWLGEMCYEIWKGIDNEQMRNGEQKTKKHKMKTKHWKTKVLPKKEKNDPAGRKQVDRNKDT